MRVELSEDGEITVHEADEQGRVTLGKQFANKRVRVAVLGSVDEATDLPAKWPRFNWDHSDVAADAPKADRQRALFAASAPGEPYWIGYDVRSGTEVGIEPDLHRRLLIAGGDARERGSALGSQLQQITARGYGAIIHLNGDTEQTVDLNERIEACDRIDDLVELHPSVPNPSGVNLIEANFGDEEYDPDNSEHQTMIRDAAGTVLDLISWKSGIENVFLVRRAIRDILGATEGKATLVDLYYIFGDREPLDSLSTERTQWLDERVPEIELTENDSETVLQRLRPWISSDRIRRAIAATEPAMSLPAMLQAGKLIEIRGENPTGLQSAIIATAVFHRARHMTSPARHHRHADRTPTYVVSDDVEALANAGQLATFLREARHQNIGFVGACPRLTGWDDAQEIIAVCDTHLTFAPSHSSCQRCAEIHSQRVTQRDLRELPEGVGYLRTTIEGARMESVKTKTFDSIDSIGSTSR